MPLEEAEDLERETIRLREERESAVDKEQGRWQEAIRDQIIKTGVPDSIVDGGGTDSGDPLDFTLTEVWQGMNYFMEQLTLANATIEKQNTELSLVQDENDAATNHIHAQKKTILDLQKSVSDYDSAACFHKEALIACESARDSWKERAEHYVNKVQDVVKERDTALATATANQQNSDKWEELYWAGNKEAERLREELAACYSQVRIAKKLIESYERTGKV